MSKNIRKLFIYLSKKRFSPNLLKKLVWWYSFYHINKKRDIQKNEFLAMKNIIGDKDSPVIIDGGANEGLYALFLSLYFPDARIVCIEPNEHLPLKENLSHLYNITILNVALGDEDKDADFYINDYSAASSLRKRETETNQRKVTVKMKTLDSLFPKAVVDILKLDLEGYDYQALLGAKELLKRTKIVYIEVEFQKEFWEGQDKTIFDVQKLLATYGFQLHSLYDMGFNATGMIKTANALFYKH